MGDLLWPRVVAAFGVDASLAMLSGLLLANDWLGAVSASQDGVRGRHAVWLRGFAGLLAVALGVQLLLLAISFSGQTSLRVVMTSMADVCSTHAGTLLVALCGVAGLVCLATWVRAPRPRSTICGVLVLAALCLHAMTGHAANDGNFSFAEWLELIHLLAMAVWSGGVIVSGLVIVPRLQRQAAGEEATAAYLGGLSLASTWAVGGVIVSGLVKAYVATGASLQPIRTTPWGQVLAVKAGLVALTVLLGARNRWLLASSRRQGGVPVRGVGKTLRLEAIFMVAVLLLSAWVANSPPPLE